MGIAISPRGDMPKYRVLIFDKDARACPHELGMGLGAAINLIKLAKS
jgi:hypothetical protein